MIIPTGIDKISFYSPRYYLPLRSLSLARNQDADKYIKGLGQEEMAICPPSEDIISMGANAAHQILQDEDLSAIEILLFATETAVDQSKSAGTWVHNLLGLSKQCRVVEIKQACYAATAAIQLAQLFLRENPQKKALIIAADIAKYGLDTPGEPTQGAGACAILLSTFPRTLMIEPEYGIYTDHVMDFWRPNYLEEGLVDGKYSIKVYLKALEESWNEYKKKSRRSFSDIRKMCYHLPFTKMALKAHEKLCSLCQHTPHEKELEDSCVYGKRVGNCYTASLYISLISLLDHCKEDLSHARIGLFSYGSGCMAEFFTAMVQPGYKEVLYSGHQAMLDSRHCVSVTEYETLYNIQIPHDGTPYTVPSYINGRYSLVGFEDHKRLYK